MDQSLRELIAKWRDAKGYWMLPSDAATELEAALADDPPSLEPKPNGCLARNTYGQACYGRRQHKDPCVFGGPVNVSPAADALREAFTRDAIALINDADNR